MKHAVRTQDRSDLIELRVGCRIQYLAEEEGTHAVILVEPHSSLQGAIRAERWEPQPAPSGFTDVYGNVCRRLDLGPERSLFAYDATVAVSRHPEPMPGEGDLQHRIEQLPSDLLHWLLPSRLCESDSLLDTAWEVFGDIPPGVERVAAVCDWIHENVAYGVPSIQTTTVAEVLERKGGMCRDFAHLGVTFCRALGLPARYVFGYMPDIGIPGPFPPMDFHAWFEVWLGEQWWTFDARFNTPRIGRLPIGRGRDAIDVAMVTTYGPASLEAMTVWADETSSESEPAGVGGSHGR
jgi:transglutaminase-like putative cysteine protease